MRTQKAAAFLLVVAVMIITICSCRAIISSPADELKAGLWKSDFDNGTNISLAFEGTTAQMRITTVGSENEQIISGGCVVSDEEFVITDASMGDVLHVKYKLSGKQVAITYQGQTISLNKQ
ncbi:MAG: hypothetical protein LBM65_07790 [Oscillospiraceae bacterium]|nr:hypothetical protein [Oscillospiraceae bacterium]